jgi:glutamine amidotransferase-like uncharacterized protein
MKPKIALFIHQPMCSVQSGNGIVNALGEYYNFKVFTKHQLEEVFFDDVDILAFPGGFGNSDAYDYLLKPNGKIIKRFIKRGGKYLGICMGAYWAGHHYFDLLDGVEAVQYYKQPTACTRRPHTKAMPVTWNGQSEKMFFNDGCAFVGDSRKYETIATYSNGQPMAIMQDQLGLIGCHPESEKFWYDSYSWMPKHWHEKQHHELLLDFVNSLAAR